MTTTNAATARKVLTEKHFPFPTEKELTAKNEREIREIAAQTGAKRMAQIAQEQRSTGLARGVTGQNSPHSAKSIADARARASASNKADKAGAKHSAAVAAKAARASKAAPKADDARKITIVDKAFVFGREGSARNAAWLTCTKSKTVAAYAAAGGALKYLPRWVAAGAIKLG